MLSVSLSVAHTPGVQNMEADEKSANAVIDFPTQLCKDSKRYSTMNTARSALSAIIKLK